MLGEGPTKHYIVTLLKIHANYIVSKFIPTQSVCSIRARFSVSTYTHIYAEMKRSTANKINELLKQYKC